MAKKGARNKVTATLPDPLWEEFGRLVDEGYMPAEIVREGVRLFVKSKRQEVPA